MRRFLSIELKNLKKNNGKCERYANFRSRTDRSARRLPWHPEELHQRSGEEEARGAGLYYFLALIFRRLTQGTRILRCAKQRKG